MYDSGITFMVPQLRQVMDSLGLEPGKLAKDLTELERHRVIEGLLAIGLSVSPGDFDAVRQRTVGDCGRPGGQWRPPPGLGLDETALAKRWIATGNDSVIRIPSVPWLTRLPWFRCAWLVPTLTPAEPEGRMVFGPPDLVGQRACEIPDFVREFLSREGLLADLDAALLFACSFWVPWHSESVRTAIPSATGVAQPICGLGIQLISGAPLGPMIGLRSGPSRGRPISTRHMRQFPDTESFSW